MLLGITGTDGAGKGTVVRYLVEHADFVHYSARAVIVEEIEQRGLPADRDHMRLIANDLRKLHGNDYVVAYYLKKFAADEPKNAVIESIRTLAESQTLKAAGGYLLAVDADPKVRYERIERRGSSSDHISYAEFLAQEQVEMNDPDPHGMQKAAVMAAADHTIYNNTTITDANATLAKWLTTVLT